MGHNKNEILRTYGVPDRITDDGAGGSILVYEKYTQTTITNASSGTYGRSSTVGGVIYGNGGVIGASQTQGGSISSIYGISQTSSNKTFCNLFLDENNIVYDFKTNYGAQYDYRRCYNKLLSWVCVGASTIIFYPSAIIAIPLGIIIQNKAKKNGEICN